MHRALKRILAAPEAPHAGALAADDFYIDRAIDLAWRGAGRVHPNPLVGAVVVREGQIVGEGYHAAYGDDHAETAALDAAGEAARGATLYVTLEPCTHFGKTPPCTDRILTSGVARVVVSTRDPDPRMNGAGIRILKQHGLRVDVGNRAERAIILNMPYFKQRLGLGGTTTLKMAATLDGRIASRPGRRDDISGPYARRFVHRLRAVHDAVIVGIDTVLVDHPRLDCRLLRAVSSPVPVVLDSRLRFPESYPWFDERRKFALATTEAAGRARIEALERRGAAVVVCPGAAGGVSLPAAVSQLRARGIETLLVEGGAGVFSSFLREGLWDAMHIVVSPRLFGPGGVSLTRRESDADRLDAVLAGVTTLPPDVMMSYLSRPTHRALMDRLT